MLKQSDIKGMDDKAIQAKVMELRGQLFTLRMQMVTVGLEKPHRVKVAKKNVARLETELNSRKSGK